MRRRRVEVQQARQAPPIRLTEPPRVRDFLTDEEWTKTIGQAAGQRLDRIATPTWRAKIVGWARVVSVGIIDPKWSARR